MVDRVRHAAAVMAAEAVANKDAFPHRSPFCAQTGCSCAGIFAFSLIWATSDYHCNFLSPLRTGERFEMAGDAGPFGSWPRGGRTPRGTHPGAALTCRN